MFLLEGTFEAAENVSAMLNIFSDFSGFCFNQDKSTLLTFGMLEEEAVRCSAILATPCDSPHLVPLHAAISWTGINLGLATGDQESGAAARGMEGSHAFAGWPFSSNQGSSICHPHFLPIHLTDPEYHSE